MGMWEEQRLGDIVPFKYGKSMTADKRLEGRYNVYSSAGICGYSDEVVANKGIIVGRKGSAGTVFYSNDPFFCIDTAFYIDEAKSECNLKFMFYYMQLLQLEKYNNDAAVPGLNRNLAHKLKIRIPDSSTQTRIADVLSTYDKLIENNNRRIELLEKAAQELYKEWFVRFRFPKHENTKFVNGLPEGWEFVKIGNAVEIIDGDRGVNYPKQEEFYADEFCLFLNTGNVTTKGFDFSNLSFITKEKDCALRKGKLMYNDVVLTTRGTVGNCAFYNSRIQYKNMRINSGMVILRNLGVVSQEYIYTVLRYEYLQKVMALYASGSAQPQLPIKDMKRIKIVKPSDEISSAFDKICEELYNQISLLITKNQNIKKQRDLLLPRVMSGRLEV